jgi:hypothetical protein
VFYERLFLKHLFFANGFYFIIATVITPNHCCCLWSTSYQTCKQTVDLNSSDGVHYVAFSKSVSDYVYNFYSFDENERSLKYSPV